MQAIMLILYFQATIKSETVVKAVLC